MATIKLKRQVWAGGGLAGLLAALRRRVPWGMRFGLGLAVAGLLLAGGWLLPGLLAKVPLATAYSARVACACRYVAGRDLASCRQDLEAGTELVRLTEDAASHTITARMLLFWAAHATYTPGPGCVLEPWKR
ncbi:MAG TPA: hypothetical protein VFF98_05185 [Novosphingobium sp.]|nr:hypothetical protein [Novosphingobium sp.]